MDLPTYQELAQMGKHKKFEHMMFFVFDKLNKYIVWAFEHKPNPEKIDDDYCQLVEAYHMLDSGIDCLLKGDTAGAKSLHQQLSVGVVTPTNYGTKALNFATEALAYLIDKASKGE